MDSGYYTEEQRSVDHSTLSIYVIGLLKLLFTIRVVKTILAPLIPYLLRFLKLCNVFFSRMSG